MSVLSRGSEADGTEQTSPPIDTTVAHSARRYDYVGGRMAVSSRIPAPADCRRGLHLLRGRPGELTYRVRCARQILAGHSQEFRFWIFPYGVTLRLAT